jgi:hypothetical protein
MKVGWSLDESALFSRLAMIGLQAWLAGLRCRVWKINSEIFPDGHAREPYTFAFRRYASDAVLTVEIVPQPNSCGLEVVRDLAAGPRASDKFPWIDG